MDARQSTAVRELYSCFSLRYLLMVCIDEFAVDPRVRGHGDDWEGNSFVKEEGGGGKAGTVVANAQALWGMLYADDAGDRVALAGEPRHCARVAGLSG